MVLVTEELKGNSCDVGEGLANTLYISRDSIRHNINAFKRKLGRQGDIIAVIKANAYGCGINAIASTLISQGLDYFALAHCKEAEAIKRSGIAARIMIFHANQRELSTIVSNGLELAISNRDSLDALNAKAKLYNKHVKVHLHIDTGMGRFGCRPSDALALAQYIDTASHLSLEGIMSHYACADKASDDDFSQHQAYLFNNCVEKIHSAGIASPYIHMGNTAAAARFDKGLCNLFRVGIGLYGVYSSKHVKAKITLKPALKLVSHITDIKTHPKGASISYGRLYRVAKDQAVIATIPLGYADGIHFCYSKRGQVLVKGQRAPIVGAICMDYMMVDVSHIDGVVVDDEVVIFGDPDLSTEHFAAMGNTRPHELIAGLGSRIQRVLF